MIRPSGGQQGGDLYCLSVAEPRNRWGPCCSQDGEHCAPKRAACDPLEFWQQGNCSLALILKVLRQGGCPETPYISEMKSRKATLEAS